MKLVRPEVDPVREKFAQARRELSSALIERDEEVDLVLTALIANEHVLLVGPPGCGKSLLLDSLLTWLGGRKFSALLTRFSVPEELFGPVSLTGLEEDRLCASRPASCRKRSSSFWMKSLRETRRSSTGF